MKRENWNGGKKEEESFTRKKNLPPQILFWLSVTKSVADCLGAHHMGRRRDYFIFRFINILVYTIKSIKKQNSVYQIDWIVYLLVAAFLHCSLPIKWVIVHWYARVLQQQMREQIWWTVEKAHLIILQTLLMKAFLAFCVRKDQLKPFKFLSAMQIKAFNKHLAWIKVWYNKPTRKHTKRTLQK